MLTLLDKIWEAHVVDRQEGQPDLLYIDRHLVHEMTSPQAFEALRAGGRTVRRPELTFAVVDHSIPTDDRSRPFKDSVAETQVAAMEKNQAQFGFTLFGVDDPRQGVIHAAMPDLGITLPGMTIVCGDSHTATHGAFGSIAFGIGTSEVEHVLASQTLRQVKPKNMAVDMGGELAKGVYSKDLILHIIKCLGVAGGTGYAIEYRGALLKKLSMEARMTICNMSIECGARMGLMAPDETTFAYLEGRPMAPKGNDFAASRTEWEKLSSDTGAEFDRIVTINAATISPQVTWGTNPGQVLSIDEAVPHPDDFDNPAERMAAEKALAYQKIKPGTKLADIPVDYAFIGSCTNARLEDLRIAASILKGRKVKSGVVFFVVPSSGPIKVQAEKEGLDVIFKEAGCQWRMPGCSMCLGMNPDVLPAGKHSASTSNRNFEDRQGRGGHTHLVSPATAAASAINGRFTDPRDYL
jgi:3-isopropylmalate/(R)-2-methylmalate dehydratase large subunit